MPLLPPHSDNVHTTFVATSITWERVNLHITIEERPIDEDDRRAPGSRPSGTDDILIIDPLEGFIPPEGLPAHVGNLENPTDDPAFSDHQTSFALWRPNENAHALEWTQLDDHRWMISVNVTNFENRKQVVNGTWRFAVRCCSAWQNVILDLSLTDDLDDKSRVFLHAGNNRAYTVAFSLAETTPDLIMRTYYFTGGRKKVDNPLVWATRAIRRTWKKTKRSALIAAYEASLAAHPHRNNTILFASEARPSLQGNLRAIRDRMLERGLDHRFTFLYSFRTEAMSDKKSALKLAWLMGQAGTIIIDDYFVLLDSFPVDGNHTIIQAWHAGSGFKDVGYSRFGKSGSPNLHNAHRHYSYAICGAEALRDTYAEVFGIERAAVIPTGLPRIDAFLNPKHSARARKEFASQFPLAANKRVILFAPTFRGRGMSDAYYDWSSFDFQALYDVLGTESVFLIRQHHFVIDPAPIPEELSDRIIDASSFADTNDLLHSVDVMITDYSSIMYEYSLLHRPMIFFAPDLDMYSATRGMHRDYRGTAPGQVVTDFDTLLEVLSRPTLDVGKTEEFIAHNFDHTDTHNSDRFIDWLLLGRLPLTISAAPGEQTPIVR
ncbi:CDP-glycerol glycerophosphotransferase family protein [Schaalia sp. ZJ1691]|uniref:CDP-glycerol glycerophosphotransferase family protein n=1 Tax=Schaalia sp. ZJ1691 TaxID=2709404 RepID=UPI0013EC2576|nr:CDP-glycerol glycerophosphotransferase family protein [Schaalia sp. ZJ1691]